MITIESLVYRYPNGTTALRGVDLEIGEGERVAIAGQNGAGKTTLVRHLNGIFTPTEGTVTVAGQNTAEHPTARLARTVGYVFQNPNQQLFARTVRAEVEFGPRNLGLDDARRAELVTWALEATRLTGLAGQHPYHLSLAERKRVALASVLAMDTPVVVLDEPTTGQDHAGVQDIAAIVAELRERGKTIIAITHDMDFCAENFDRVVLMADGRVIRDAPARAAFSVREDVAAAAVEEPQMLRLSTALGLPPAITVDQFLKEIAP